MNCLEALAAVHEVCALVRPGAASGPRRLLRTLRVATGLLHDAVGRWARSRGVPTIRAGSRDDPRVREALLRMRPDLVCVAHYPWILTDDVLTLPALGVVNAHASALPRHRGASPIFWTYHGDDRETALTIHRAGPVVDAGPILQQERIPISRGMRSDQLYLELSRIAGRLMATAVQGLASGALAGTPQDESAATRAPRVRPGARMVPFDRWPVERVWHFLGGLHPRFEEPLFDSSGRRVRYGGVLGYQETSGGLAPGNVERIGARSRLWCRGGFVELDRPPRLRRPWAGRA